MTTVAKIQDTYINALLADAATVWKGRAQTDYANKIYISMRGSQQGTDFLNDADLFFNRRRTTPDARVLGISRRQPAYDEQFPEFA
jgi:hypothetical protein